MKYFRKCTLLIFLLACTGAASAQELLTLKNAVALALEHNYGLKIYADSVRIAVNNNTAGNAGMLPQVGSGAGLTYGNSNIHQAYTGRADVLKNGVVSTGRTANLGLSYNLFDGLRMYATRHKLRELEFLAGNTLNTQMETTIVQVMLSYYNIVRAVQNQHVTMEAIRIDDERIKIADTKFRVGAGNKIDLLQAKVDRNQDQSALMAQQITVDSVKVYLNQLLARDVNSSFEPADTNLVVSFFPSYTALIDSALKKNFALRNASSLIRISEYNLRQVKADYYPTLTGNAGYVFSKSTSTAGFSLYSQSYGPQLGLNLSWNLFNGFNVKRRVSNSRLALDASHIQYQNIFSMTMAGITAQYKNFQNTVSTLQLEEENIKVAHENLDIALAKYRLGGSTQLELMTAEQSLVASLNRLVLARYKSKLAESTLLRLSGALVN